MCDPFERRTRANETPKTSIGDVGIAPGRHAHSNGKPGAGQRQRQGKNEEGGEGSENDEAHHASK